MEAESPAGRIAKTSIIGGIIGALIAGSSGARIPGISVMKRGELPWLISRKVADFRMHLKLAVARRLSDGARIRSEVSGKPIVAWCWPLPSRYCCLLDAHPPRLVSRVISLLTAYRPRFSFFRHFPPSILSMRLSYRARQTKYDSSQRLPRVSVTALLIGSALAEVTLSLSTMLGWFTAMRLWRP